MNYFDNIIEKYNQVIDKIPQLHKIEGGGRSRKESGIAFENLIDNLCAMSNLKAKRNDYKTSEMIDGYQVKNLQVDKHIYFENVLIKMVESKTYLDACYLKRAVDDFVDLYNSPDVGECVEFAILTGQRCVSEETMNYHLAKFKKKTGKQLKIFVVNSKKQRNAKRAIYMQEYRNDFYLDIKEIREFLTWIQN